MARLHKLNVSELNVKSSHLVGAHRLRLDIRCFAQGDEQTGTRIC